MSACLQSQAEGRSLTVLEHGDRVLQHYVALMSAALEERFPSGWRQPKWWPAAVAQELHRTQPSEDIMHNYLRYHDCGKPKTLQVDEHGRSHFPGHAAASADVWQSLGGHPDEVWLMKHDMLLHEGSAQACEAIRRERLAPGLLFAALAELHANATMFGGVDSVSFKIKAKHLDRRGGQLLRQ